MKNNGTDVFLFLADAFARANEFKDYPTVRLTKITDCENPRHAKNIHDGFVKEGKMVRPLKVGESFYINYDWATSVVQEILEDGKFRTMNSYYKLEVI